MWDLTVYVLYLLVLYLIWKLLFDTPDYVLYYAKFGFYIICTQMVSLVLIPVMALSPRNLRNGFIVAQILKHVMKFIGVKWELRNEKVILEERGAVIVANHQSSLDILGQYNISHVAPRVAPVCKKELLYLFPFGLAAYLTGCIFIDRKKPKEAHNILKAEAEVLFKNKSKIWLYPEGTRNKSSDKMQPFRIGAFRLAIACQAPIIPVVMSPYYFMDAKKRIFKRGHVIIQILEAVTTEGLTIDDLPELKDRVQKMMEDTYERLGKEIATTLAAEN